MSHVLTGIGVILTMGAAFGLCVIAGLALIWSLEERLPRAWAAACAVSVSWLDYFLGPPELRSANPDLSDYKTVDEIITGMGLEPTKDLTWPVGRKAAKFYSDRYARDPVQDRRTKTTGSGSHSKTVYAPMLVSAIQQIVRDEALIGESLDELRAFSSKVEALKNKLEGGDA